MTLGKVLLASRSIEEHVEFVGGTIGDADNNIGVHHVVNQRDVLVTDALDVVFAKTVLEHCRALKCFDGNNLSSVQILQAIAGSNCSGGTGGRCECS